MSTLISIIVPCYNQSQYLNECLQSVLNQSHHDWECIIVNDGSNDNTEEIALQWTNKDSRFYYLKKENGGLCSARNYGIEQSNGIYILPLDCDDKIGKEYLKLGLKIIKDNKNIGVVYSKARFFEANTKPWILPSYDKKLLLCRNHIFCSGIFLKDDWRKIGGYDENMKYGWEDWEFWINLLYSLNKEAYKINYEGFYYRQKKDSMVTTLNRDQTKQTKLYNYIFNKHKIYYSSNFQHPVLGYYKLWKHEHKTKMLIYYINKITALFH